MNKVLRKGTFYALIPFFLFIFCMTLTGCSEDNVSNSATRASILVTHEISGRSLGSDIKSFSCSCYAESGLRTFGPATVSKAHQVLLQAIPAYSKSLRIIYYNNDGEVVGVYSQPVSLNVGETYEVTNPAWEDLDKVSNMVGLEVSFDEGRVHTGDQTSILALASFKSGQQTYRQFYSDLCDWQSSNTSVANNYEGDTELDPGTYLGVAPGTATIKTSFGSYSASSVLEVTDATVKSAALSANTLTLPLERNFYLLSFYTTWSDGKVIDSSMQTSWSTTNKDALNSAYGILCPYALTVDEPVVVTAYYSCGEDTFNDKCEVSVVAAYLSDLAIELDPATAVVGELVSPIVYGRYKLYSDDTYINDLEIQDESYALSVADTSVATVEDTFWLRAIAVGTTDVTATLVDDATKTCTAELVVTAE